MLLLSWGALKDTLSLFSLASSLSFIFVLFLYPHDFAVVLFKAAFECGRKECLCLDLLLHPSTLSSLFHSLSPSTLSSSPPSILPSSLTSVVVGVAICCLQSRCDRLRVCWGGLSLSLARSLNLEGLFERLQGFGGWWRLENYLMLV